MLSLLANYVGARFGPSMLKRSYDADFSAPAPPGAQNHVKTRFCNIAKMKSIAAEGPETP